MLFTSGCWDRVEVNDIALIMGTAFDLDPEGKLQMSVQVMLPLGTGTEGFGGGQNKKSYIVETSTGTDPGEMLEEIQGKFSRKLFRAHRRAIIIGEDLARQGVEDLLDSLSRDPENRLSTPILVTKGCKGVNLLRREYPLERVPAEAIREMEHLGMGVEITVLDFLTAAASEGIQPIAAAIEPGEDKDTFQLPGIGVFKDLKLAGYLNAEEVKGYLWVTGKLRRGTMAISVPGKKGIISLDIRKASSKIRPVITKGKVRVYVELSGEGVIHGNSTNVDTNKSRNVELIEREAEKSIKKTVQLTLNTVQEKYESDIFGFGTRIYENSPKEWQHLKENWEEIFSEAEVLVSADFFIRSSGMLGPPLDLKINELKQHK